MPLKEGQLKITESKFYRISGDSTQHRGVIPDIDFPSLFDFDQIGESALDNALSWDQIAPAQFNRYHDYERILPRLSDLHKKRAANDPDYLYLEDQVEIAREARSIKTIPLQEAGRLALRDEQQAKALAIENKLRAAKGMDLLTELNGSDEEVDALETALEEPALSEAGAEESPAREEDDTDVLLLETGRILVDSIALRPDTSIAGRAGI